MKIIYLPATASDDPYYGHPQDEWLKIYAKYKEAECAVIQFDSLVWYNKIIRKEAFCKIAEVCDGNFSDVILVGFSKSGCGVVNIIFDNPDLFKAAIIFDSPLVNDDINKFELSEFYRNSKILKADVPIVRIKNGASYGATKLILVHGSAFSSEMALFSEELSKRNMDYQCINDIQYEHNWNSGWIIRAIGLTL